MMLGDKRVIDPTKISSESWRAMQALRSSNAAQPHKNKKAYSRKPKHKRVDWE